MMPGHLKLSPASSCGPVLDWMLSQAPKISCRPDVVATDGGAWEARYASILAHGPTRDVALKRCMALAALGQKVLVPAQVLRSGAVEAVAACFALDVRKHLLTRPDGDARYWELVQANGVESDPGICHAHDHCDANMVMAGAIECILGVDPADGYLLNDPLLMEIWNEAWGLAKKKFLPDPLLAGSRMNALAPGVANPMVLVPAHLILEFGAVVRAIEESAPVQGDRVGPALVSQDQLERLSVVVGLLQQCLLPEDRPQNSQPREREA